MYIKIKHSDKTELHHCKSYFKNDLEFGFDFNIILIDESEQKHHFKQGDNVKVFVISDNGKVIDAI